MPRLSCSDAKEYRFTLGDYERSHIVKPLKQKLEHDTYIEYAKVLVWPLTLIGSAWFIGKGISGVWDDWNQLLPWEPIIDPETGEERKFNAANYPVLRLLFGLQSP